MDNNRRVHSCTVADMTGSILVQHIRGGIAFIYLLVFGYIPEKHEAQNADGSGQARGHIDNIHQAAALHENLRAYNAFCLHTALQ